MENNFDELMDSVQDLILDIEEKSSEAFQEVSESKTLFETREQIMGFNMGLSLIREIKDLVTVVEESIVNAVAILERPFAQLEKDIADHLSFESSEIGEPLARKKLAEMLSKVLEELGS